jgi:hypothetical protein
MRPIPPVLLPLLSLSLLAAGCRNPEDPVFIFGRAQKADGSPLGGLALGLERGPALHWSDDFEGMPPREYLPYGEAITTEADGDFTLEALAGDLQAQEDFSYVSYPLRVVLPLQDGQGVFVTFDNMYGSQGDVELPPLRPWDARLSVDVGAQGPRLSFAAPPSVELPPSATPLRVGVSTGGDEYEPVDLSGLPPEPLLSLSSGGERLWWLRGTRDAWTPSPYVLEDFASPQAQLRALSLGQWYFSPLAALSGFLSFRLEWRTAPVPVPAGTLRPVSRGASCEPAPPGACPWTDGRLARVALPDTPEESAPPPLVITLDTPTRLRRAVLRGLEYGFISLDAKTLLVEGSVDGVSWTLLGEQRVQDVLAPRQESLRFLYQDIERPLLSVNPYGDPPLDRFGEEPLYADVPLRDTEPVRQVRVRVRLDDGGRDSPLIALAEMSLFATE